MRPTTTRRTERGHADDKRSGIECRGLRDASGVDAGGRVQAHANCTAGKYAQADRVTLRVSDERCEQDRRATNLRTCVLQRRES